MKYSTLSNQTLPYYQQQWILEVENLISEQADKPDLVIADIAHEMGMSERQLYRQIKQIRGITPNTLIQNIRMEIAKNHLERGSYATVAELAYAVGYSRADYFSHVFFQRYQRRPIEFMR